MVNIEANIKLVSFLEGIMIPRLPYLTQLEQVRDKQIIKVLTGVRQAGKSTILTMHQAWLKEHGVHPNQIQAINVGLNKETVDDLFELGNGLDFV